jgi:hypothetical protein
MEVRGIIPPLIILIAPMGIPKASLGFKVVHSYAVEKRPDYLTGLLKPPTLREGSCSISSITHRRFTGGRKVFLLVCRCCGSAAVSLHLLPIVTRLARGGGGGTRSMRELLRAPAMGDQPDMQQLGRRMKRAPIVPELMFFMLEDVVQFALQTWLWLSGSVFISETTYKLSAVATMFNMAMFVAKLVLVAVESRQAQRLQQLQQQQYAASAAGASGAGGRAYQQNGAAAAQGLPTHQFHYAYPLNACCIPAGHLVPTSSVVHTTKAVLGTTMAESAVPSLARFGVVLMLELPAGCASRLALSRNGSSRNQKEGRCSSYVASAACAGPSAVI